MVDLSEVCRLCLPYWVQQDVVALERGDHNSCGKNGGNGGVGCGGGDGSSNVEVWWSVLIVGCGGYGCRGNNGARGGGSVNSGSCGCGGNGGDCDYGGVMVVMVAVMATMVVVAVTDGSCGGGNNGGGNGIGGISVPLTESITSTQQLLHFSQQAGLNQAEATITSDNGEYLLELSIGTPPFPIKGIADTGSDLIWTQCNPCVSCYKQKDPVFEPKKSSTYKALSCSSSQCNSLNGTCSSESSSNCQYEVTYGDQSYSYGDFARETLTLESTTGRNIAFPETLIGCGFDNKFTAGRGSASGIVGLGGGSESLITQLGSSIGGKFSHCLVPLGSETTSKLNFGSNAVVTGAGVVSTPIVQGQDPKTFYFLTLEGISVGNTRIPSSSSAVSSGEGNIIIDSGTTLTILPPSVYSDLEAEVDKAVGSLEHVRLPGVPLNLCYKISESSSDDFKPPTITVHFSGGDLKLPPTNTFIRVSEEAVCFAFGSSPSVLIFGNLSQMNFLVGYDTKEGTVSFKPTDCTKQQ
ncbi:aspartic proteinase CDR1-like [Pyrus x bretschneideri]|uniref:aspartic proteinase CDR1-like n=1 Tax=Pyrus x bretschneideri TaxID=225117 RepID=UPI00202E3296|nr:aspartic proteinase CDR1-like [Pyrus x bretschneideri]